jgi:hypothetical protein
MPLFSSQTLTAEAKRRSFFATGAAAWAALLGVLLLTVVTLLRPAPKSVDVLAEINAYAGAEFFAHNFLLVWLAGGPGEAEKLVSMSARTGQPEMNRDPVTVSDINAVPPISRTPAGAEIEWGITLAATLIPPGAGRAIRTFYRVTFLEAGGTYKALVWPRPVNDTSRTVQVAPWYTNGIGLNTPVGTAVSNFMSAFYTSNNAGTLGRFVSADFTEEPIAISPYTSIEVKAITAGKDSPDAASAKPGDTINLLVTAKAASSTTTFNTIDAPLRVTLGANRQWLVDGFDEPVHFGAVDYQ